MSAFSWIIYFKPENYRTEHVVDLFLGCGIKQLYLLCNRGGYAIVSADKFAISNLLDLSFVFHAQTDSIFDEKSNSEMKELQKEFLSLSLQGIMLRPQKIKEKIINELTNIIYQTCSCFYSPINKDDNKNKTIHKLKQT